MSLLLITYPVISEEDQLLIDGVRKEHDALYNIVGSHFTLIFPIEGICKQEFIAEVKERLAGCCSFSFSIHCAVAHKDELSNASLVFLVPYEGYHQFISIHHKAYSGKFNKYLKQDIPYIPHMTIGRSSDITNAQNIAEAINLNRIDIRGIISAVDIVSYENNKVISVEKVLLSHSTLE